MIKDNRFMIRATRLFFPCAVLGLSACGGGSGNSSGSAPQPSLVVATPSLPSPRAGSSVTAPLAASGGTPPYAWSITSGTLPAGISFNAAGVLAGTPMAAGTGSLGLAVTDSGHPAQSAAKTYSWSVLPATLVETTSVLPTAAVDTAYATTLAADGGTPPYVWTITSGALPTGLALSATGVISGTAASAGSTTVQITVTDSEQPAQTATQTLNLTVVPPRPLAISTDLLPNATVHLAFSQSLTAAGGSGAYVWAVPSGGLPSGLTLSTGGVLSGTPGAPGIATFVVKVRDSASPANVASKMFNLIIAAPGAPVQVGLATTPSGITIDSSFVGFSYEKSMLSTEVFSSADTALITLFKRLGPGVLRIGGVSTDYTVWNPTGAGQAPHEASPPDIARLAGFLQATQWKALYGIEFLDKAASPVVFADPALVAAEAVHVMQTLGDQLYGFEIGNEPDLYYRKVPHFKYADFQANWQTYRSAILSAVASAKAAGTLPQNANPVFTGPAAADNDLDYVAPFAAAEGQHLSLLSRHYYIADGTKPTATMEAMLAPDPKLPAMLSFMAETAATAGITGGFRIPEANSFYYGGAPGVSDAFGSSLWAINFLFTSAWGAAAGVNFHGGGLVAYSPISDDYSTVLDVRPEYYGIYLFAQAAKGALLATTTTPATKDLYAYAVAAAGATKVVLVNASATTASNVSIRFDGGVSQAAFLSLTGPSLWSTTGQRLNGAVIAADGNWTPTAAPKLPIASGVLQIPVPAASAILVTAQ